MQNQVFFNISGSIQSILHFDMLKDLLWRFICCNQKKSYQTVFEIKVPRALQVTGIFSVDQDSIGICMTITDRSMQNKVTVVSINITLNTGCQSKYALSIWLLGYICYKKQQLGQIWLLLITKWYYITIATIANNLLAMVVMVIWLLSNSCQVKLTTKQ